MAFLKKISMERAAKN